jgi:tetratricopeptide (TPR) repeat protein
MDRTLVRSQKTLNLVQVLSGFYKNFPSFPLVSGLRCPLHETLYFSRQCGYLDRGPSISEPARCAFQPSTQSISLNPRHTNAYLNRGTSYGQLKRYREAIADYTQTIRLNPRYALAYFNRGLVNERMGNRDKAVADYRAAYKIVRHPKIAAALRRLGAKP